MPGLPGQPNTLHRYAYAFNNPVNYVDPAGTRSTTLPFTNNVSQPRNERQDPAYLTALADWLSAPGSSPRNSVNAIAQGLSNWRSHSEALARQLSQGLRPRPCGLGAQLSSLWTSLRQGNLLHDLVWWGLHEYQTNPFWHQRLTPEQQWYMARLLLSAGVGFIPGVGDVYDLISGVVGYDLITGDRLAWWERGLAFAPLAGVGLGLLADRWLRRLDDATAFRLRHLDEFTAGDWALLREDELRRALGGFDEGALARRLSHLDEATAARLRNLDEFTAGDQALLWGDELRRALGGLPSEMPGRVVDIDEAARLSGIPQEYLKQIRAVHIGTETIGGYRTANPLLERLRTKTWPKDPNAEVFHPITGEKLKISSMATPRFKTTEHGIVGTRLKIGRREIEYGIVRRPNGSFELVDMRRIVDSKGNVILDPLEGIPMGPDIDTYFFLRRAGTGWVNLGTDTPGELALRELVSSATSDYRPALGYDLPAIVHGPAQPYDPSASWGDALVAMPDGRLIWLEEHEVETFFQYHGLTSKQKGPSGEPFNWLEWWIRNKSSPSYSEAASPNAQVALQRKLSALEHAQANAARIRILPDGRIRYYRAERAAEKPGPTRGASYVTEWNPETGSVRSWIESYNHAGEVSRVHPKMINGQPVYAPHYPPTGSERGR